MLNNRGSLLITGLWAMSIFATMSTSLIFNASQHMLMMKREFQAFQAKADFVFGLNHAAALIQTDPYPHEDSPQDAWFGEMVSPMSSPNAFIGDPFLEKKFISMKIEDEESKINLNRASETLLKNFFKIFEENITVLKGSRKDYVKGIAKLRSGKTIESLEELLLMEDFEKEDFEGLKPYLTVYPDQPLININTAGPLVLKALMESLPGDHGSKQILMARLEEPPRRVFLSQDLRPDLFAENLKLPKTLEMSGLVQRFLAAAGTDSETFSINMKSKSGREARGIFRSREGQLRPEVLWWHEE